jgi:hypothetical protein
LDSLVKLTDAAGRTLASNDDHEDKGAGLVTDHADSYLSLTLPADGTYYLHLSDQQHQGGPEYAYRLRIGPPRPDFGLRIVPSSVNAIGGGSVPVTVYALRRDEFSGEIGLALKDAPEGFVLSGGRIPANQDQVRVTLRVPPVPPKELVSLHVEGRATIEGREVVHAAVPAEDMIQAFDYRHLVPCQEFEAAVTPRPAARRLVLKILSKTPVRIPVGGTAEVRVAGPTAMLGRIALALSGAPDGISIKKVSPIDRGAEIVLQSDAAKTKSGLKGNLIVTASAKAGAARKGQAKGPMGAAPVATLPAIPFEVVDAAP